MEPNQAISGGPGTAPSPWGTAPGETVTRRSGIPAPVTALVGRRRECEGVTAALDSSRLVTLMGPGGVGKSRLALAVAAQLQARFGGRAWWVELAPVTRDDMAAQAIADAIGARDASGLNLAESIAARVADHPALIVLDNCEHLTGGCREAADRLLTMCPRLHILATSREPLGAAGESRWPLPPLTVPPLAAPSGTWVTSEQDGAIAAPGATALLAGSEAMQFFLDRARAVLPGFEITDGNAELIGQLCRRLDGLPLALELAAAKLRVMAVNQVLAGLDDVFKLLVGGRQGAPVRHQTLRAALDWSYDMLQPGEQAALRRLSVFAGSFCLAAAQAVATLGGADPADVLDLLARLVDRSLLLVEHTPAQARYRMLATVRRYGAQRLAESGEFPAASEAMLAWYLDLAERTEAELSGRDLAQAAERLQAEAHNLRAVLQAARDRKDIAGTLRLATALLQFWYLRGHYREGRDWLDWALAAPEGAPAEVRAKALAGSGMLAHLQCEYPAAVRRLEAALALYRELGDRRGVAGILSSLGSVAREQSRYARARELQTEALAEFEALGDRPGMAGARDALGFAAWLEGDFATTQAECTQALAAFTELGDAEGAAGAELNLGVAAMYQGEHEAATAALARSGELAEQVGFREGVAWALHERGLLAVRRGEPGASALLREALDIHRDLGDRWRVASVLDDLAAAALAGQPPDAARAARLLGAAQHIRAAIGTAIAPCERADHARTEASARAALGEAAFDRLAQAGAAEPLDDVLAHSSASAALPQDASAPAVPSTGFSAERTAPADQRPGHQPPSVARAGAGDRAGPPPAPAGEVLRLRLLGQAAVHLADRLLTPADWGYAKPRELLCLFASSPPLAREQIGLALWPELTGGQLRNALHSALRQLRRTLGDGGWIGFTDGRYALDESRPLDCDLRDFEQALAAARAAQPPVAALPQLRRAIAAYGGDFLADSTAGDWATTRRAGLRRAYERALGAAGRLLVAEGRVREAIEVYRRAIAHEPLDEAAHRALMECWAAAGQPARAMRHYEELRDLLRTEVGGAPAAQTTALYARLRDAAR
ncbi:MAG TPA: BTAD domain-containing putative transcriptional regulator [Streptosporangiaceae bacterium]|nr:BTAD domain-containing putative transcriptional regulator [Streptosporangiaceae bacterium]